MIAAQQQTWIGIIGALVPSLIALVAAVVGILNRRQLATTGSKSIGQLATEVSGQLKTGNEKTVGEMMTEVHGEASENGIQFEQHGTPPPVGKTQ